MNYLLILCTLAVGHGIFISIALLVMSRRLSNKLLALLLVLLALRVGKSVVQLFLQPDMSYTTSVIGVTAMAAIGPALFLLMRSFFNTAFVVKPSHNLHFIPSALLPLTLFTDWKLLAPVYYFFTAHVLVYASVCWLITLKNREVYKTDDVKWKWSLMVLTATTILGFTFVLQVTVYQPIVYATNVIVAALMFYGLSLWAIKRSRLFLPEPSAKSENTDVLDDLGKRIKALLENNEAFTDSTLSVSSLAARLKSPPYLISRAVNHYFRKSFSELLVDYRIKKAEQLLLSPSGKVYTIEAVAFESGFNTLSAFYASFKKINGITPAQFRETRRA